MLAAVIVLAFISMRVMGLSFSQEKVHFAIEEAMHYGPSDEILYKYTDKDGRGVVVGKCGDEGLSITHTIRKLGLLYGVDTDFNNVAGDMTEPVGYAPCEKEISLMYMPSHDMICGMCYNDRVKEIVLTGGTRNDEYFAERITPDGNGFFCLSDLSTLYDKDSIIDGGGEGLYYFYAESSEPAEGTDIKVSSNLTKGQIIDREELNKIIPDENDFMSLDDMNNIMNFTGDELNKINAGIKKYTGINFFATGGCADGETVWLTYKPKVWTDRELALTFVKNGANYVPKATEENMDTAAVMWFKMNYGKSYELGDILSDKINTTEKDGKKQYRTLLSSDMLLKPEKVTENDNTEKRYGRHEEMFVEVVDEADLEDPGAPWKMYYDDGLSGELRDIDELYIDGVPDGMISEEMVGEFNELLAPIEETSPGNITSTEISCFFTSFYDKPEDIDLAEFLSYCPLREGVDSEEEFQKVKEAASFELPDNIEDMNTPVWRYKREVIDELLMKYAGITTSDLTGKTRGRTELVYVESTDSYYNFTSDFGPGTFDVIKGEKEGSLYYLYNNKADLLTLRRTEEGIKILSHTKGL